MLNIGIAIQLLSFSLYVGYIVFNWGILKSISDSYYYLTKSKQVYFLLFCWGIGIPFMLYSNPLFLFAGFGFIVTGIASDYKIYESGFNKLTWWVHHIAAISGILFSYIGIWVVYNGYIYILLFFVSLLVLFRFKVKNIIWWIEIFAFIFILIGLIINNTG